MPEISFDYSTAQWVLSIIVGVCLTKVYNTVAHHIRHRREIIFYVPYLLLIGHIFFILISLWFTSPYTYQMVEGNRLAFLIRIIIDSIAVIVTLLALPSEQMLSKSNLNLETIYQDSKKDWAVIMMIWTVIGSLFNVFFGPTDQNIQQMLVMMISANVLTFIWIVLVLKYNNLYLHTVFQIYGISVMLLVILLSV